MHALKIVEQILGRTSSVIHGYRRQAMEFAAGALMRSGHLSLTGLGRGALSSKTTTKHNIKRIDRLLGNQRLQAETLTVYGALARELLGAVKEPVIVIDWTDLKSGNVSALRAAIPVGGRAVPIFAEVHPEKRKGSPLVHKRFLQGLQRVLPQGCIPILVIDAGFRTSWYRAVVALGWNYVGRVRGVNAVLFKGQWHPVQRLFVEASSRPYDLGQLLFTKGSPLLHRCVLIKRKARARHARLHKRDRRRRINDTVAKKYRRGQREPWILITSLREASAKRIVNLYRTRMQIEETFRDEKSPRFGWSLNHARCQSPKRMEVLLLIAALGLLATIVVGLLAESDSIHRSYQANTVRHRVLSWFRLGCAIIRDHRDRLFAIDRLRAAVSTLCAQHIRYLSAP